MGCTHPHGDHINGIWVCASCFKKLHERPHILAMERGSLVSETGRKPRQIVIYAPIAIRNGLTFAEFVTAMARRIVARTRGGMHMDDARDYALCILRGLAEPFGAESMDWSECAASDLVDEDMQYWDADDARNQ